MNGCPAQVVGASNAAPRAHHISTARGADGAGGGLTVGPTVGAGVLRWLARSGQAGALAPTCDAGIDHVLQQDVPDVLAPHAARLEQRKAALHRGEGVTGWRAARPRAARGPSSACGRAHATETQAHLLEEDQVRADEHCGGWRAGKRGDRHAGGCGSCLLVRGAARPPTRPERSPHISVRLSSSSPPTRMSSCRPLPVVEFAAAAAAALATAAAAAASVAPAASSCLAPSILVQAACC